MNQLLILQSLATAAVLLLAFTEAMILQRYKPGQFDWAQARLSLGDMLGRRIIALAALDIGAPLFEWVWQKRIFTVEMNAWVQFVWLFLGFEFLYYWYHRLGHRVRFFWASHAVHHSSQQLSLFSALRLGWTSTLTGSSLFFAPLVLLGFTPLVVLAALSMNLLYQFCLHTTWIPKLGWLEYVFNTPSSHRVHHASNTCYLDANFGGVLIVFDRLFGSYREERAQQPCVYGLHKPAPCRNLLDLEFQHWRELWRDLCTAPRWQDRWVLLVRAPQGLSKPPDCLPH